MQKALGPAWLYADRDGVSVSLILTRNCLIRVSLLLLTTWSFAILTSWPMALMLMIGLIPHEYGHLWMAQRLKIRTSGFIPLPFVGGVAMILGLASLKQRVKIALMGATWGLLETVGLAAAGWYWQQPILAAAALVTGSINLVNLVPFSIADGGRIVQDLLFSYRRWLGMVAVLAGTVVLEFLALYHHSWALGALLVFSLPWVVAGLVPWTSQNYPTSYTKYLLDDRLSLKGIGAYFVAYLLLAVSLTGTLWWSLQVSGAVLQIKAWI